MDLTIRHSSGSRIISLEDHKLYILMDVFQPVHVGVPQGHILGYVLFTEASPLIIIVPT